MNSENLVELLDCSDILKAKFFDKFKKANIIKICPNEQVIVADLIDEREEQYVFRYNKKLDEFCIESSCPEEIAKYL